MLLLFTPFILYLHPPPPLQDLFSGSHSAVKVSALFRVLLKLSTTQFHSSSCAFPKRAEMQKLYVRATCAEILEIYCLKNQNLWFQLQHTGSRVTPGWHMVSTKMVLMYKGLWWWRQGVWLMFHSVHTGPGLIDARKNASTAGGRLCLIPWGLINGSTCVWRVAVKLSDGLLTSSIYLYVYKIYTN